MPEVKSREIRLKSRPTGTPAAEHFDLAEAAIPAPKEGEFLVRNIWMSVDPYMRGRMRDGPSYSAPFRVGAAMEGGCVGQVVDSKNPNFKKGDYVLGMLGWREYWLSSGPGAAKIDPKLAPIQSFLGALGMPGLTAYVGLLKIAELKDGETVFVSAASGAVGAVVCQIAKAKGCKVVGSAGSDEKVAWLKNEIGIDAAFNYKKADIAAELAKACPGGIDVYFENVGGKHLDAALLHLKNFGRIAVCGMIEQYNASTPQPGPSNFIMVIPKRLRIQGFIVSDHFDMQPKFLGDMGKWIAAGKMKWQETVVDGLENAPQAFLGLFKGENKGKMLVKVGSDPAV